jgi:hypothetical protein
MSSASGIVTSNPTDSVARGVGSLKRRTVQLGLRWSWIASKGM